MKNSFPFLIFIALIVGLGTTYLLHNQNLCTIINEPYIRHILQVVIAVAGVIIVLTHFKPSVSDSTSIFGNENTVAVALSCLLCATLFNINLIYIAMLTFCMLVLLHFVFRRKLYRPNKLLSGIIIYGILLMTAALVSSNDFRFPTEITVFFLVPLSFYFFRLSKDNWNSVALVFIRFTMVYMTISIIYWSFNHYYLETDFIHWITHKLSFQAEMIGWEEQFKTMYETNYFSAYFFVNSWSGYFHPSYISTVLCSGLVLAFYLFQQNSEKTPFSKIELGAYIVLCLTMEALMESRIGIVGVVLIVTSCVVYLSKANSKHYKLLIVLLVLSTALILYLFNNSIISFLTDEVRTIYRNLSYEYISQHPWWGTGYGQQSDVLNALMKQNYPESPYVYMPIPYVHNQFLGNMVQFGVWGALALSLLFIVLTIQAFKNKDFYLLLYLGFYFLFMMIEEPLSREDGIMRFIIFLVFLCTKTDISNNSQNFKCENKTSK